MAGIIEFLKGEKSFYKYTKQTILHILYRVLVACFVFDIFLISIYVAVSNEKVHSLEVLLYLFSVLTLVVIGTIVWIHIYYIHIKKDITPLQSEHHQILKEILTKAHGDSNSGLDIVEGIKALTEGNGENQGPERHE